MASTQDALYRRIDLDLSWSERELPERERTKHVHRLHPYLGKFIPQLVEALLERYVPPWPRARSVRRLGDDARAGARVRLDASGADVAAFNCLLMQVKTREYNPFVLESELRDAIARLEGFEGARPEAPASKYLRDWFAPKAAAELLFFRGARRGLRARRRAAGRAGAGRALGAPDDAFRPRLPARAAASEYWCHKHRRTCRPVGEARRFLRRYSLDTLEADP